MGEDGLAAGELREGEAFGPVLDLAGEGRVRLGLATGGEPDPMPTAAERGADRDIMRRGLAWCARHGITSIQNMDGNLYQLELLAEIEAEGGLALPRADSVPLQEFHDARHARQGVADGRRYNSEWLSSGMVKVFYDGVLEFLDRRHGRALCRPAGLARRAAVHAAAIRRRWPSRPTGAACRSPFMRSATAPCAPCSTATRRRRRPTAGATAATASSISRSPPRRRAALRRTRRHRLDAAAASARRHGLSARADDVAHRPARWPLSYAWRTLKDAGAHVCLRLGLAGVADRPDRGHAGGDAAQTLGRDGPDQSFSLQEALPATRSRAPMPSSPSTARGALKPGYMADLVVLSADIEKPATAQELHKVRPVTTICGGKVTYQA